MTMQLDAARLVGTFVSLEPVVPAMREEMRTMLDVDAQSWAIQYVCGLGEHFDSYWDAMTFPVERGNRIAFAVRLRSTGRIIATSSFHHISPPNRTVEIGSTFLRPEVRGTAVNPEMKLLMLEHAFSRGALRVQLTVDNRNQRSQRAVAKLGAVREGVLRRHLVTWTGHLRDTVVFSILAEEWPQVRDGLLKRLDVPFEQRPVA